MKFKNINPSETVFFIFETTSKKYSVFDSEIDLPIYVGSWNMTAGIIRSLKKDVKNLTIYYYSKEKTGLRLSPAWSVR